MMHVTDEPSERPPRHDVLDAGVGLLDRGAIEDRKQDPGHDQHHEEEIGDPARRVAPADIRRQAVLKRLPEGLVDLQSAVDRPIEQPDEAHHTKEARVGAGLDVVPHPACGLPRR